MSEESSVADVARKSFVGYKGHYHADKRLRDDRCDQVYVDWAYRSATKEYADEVLVAVLDESIVGFITLSLNAVTEAEIELVGVTPEKQRRGILGTLVAGAAAWAQLNDVENMTVSTQIVNVAAQRVYERLGFTHARAYYTFHKWFE